MNMNLIKNIVYGVIVFILLSLQSTRAIAILGINPDFLLVLAVLHSMYFGEYKGVIFGFSIGLLEDVLSGSLFGVNAFVLTLIAWLINVYKKYVFMTDVVAFWVYIALAVVIKYILYFGFNLLFVRESLFDGYYILRMLGEIVYNSVIAFVFFYLAPLIYKREESIF